MSLQGHLLIRKFSSTNIIFCPYVISWHNLPLKEDNPVIKTILYTPDDSRS